MWSEKYFYEKALAQWQHFILQGSEKQTAVIQWYTVHACHAHQSYINTSNEQMISLLGNSDDVKQEMSGQQAEALLCLNKFQEWALICVTFASNNASID